MGNTGKSESQRLRKHSSEGFEGNVRFRQLRKKLDGKPVYSGNVYGKDAKFVQLGKRAESKGRVIWG